MTKRIAIILIVLLAFCGIANSAYLTQSEKSGSPLICNVQSLTGCNTVAQSPYSQIFGISLAEYGLLFYGLVFFIAALELFLVNRMLRRTLQVLGIFGFFASIYFVSLQVLVIKALCIYCMASAVLTVLVFIAATFIEPIKKDKDAKPVIKLPPAPVRPAPLASMHVKPMTPPPPPPVPPRPMPPKQELSKPPQHLPMPPKA